MNLLILLGIIVSIVTLIFIYCSLVLANDEDESVNCKK